MPQSRISRFAVLLKQPQRIPHSFAVRGRRLALRAADNFKLGVYRAFHPIPEVMLKEIAPPLSEHFEIIMDDICLPPYHDINDNDDAGALFALVKALNPKVVLELGTAHGNTVANLCRLSKAHFYTVSALPEQMSGTIITFALSKEEIGRVYRRYGFSDRVSQIYTNTLDFDPVRHSVPSVVDLAIIDACHDTEYVINDFYKVLPTLNAGATVLLHDTHSSMKAHLGGSYRACVALRKQGFPIKHIKDTWWGYYKHEKSQPSA